MLRILEDLLRRIGGDVYYSDIPLPAMRAGSIVIINEGLSEEQKILEVSHEIAHIALLHQKPASRGEVMQQEINANTVRQKIMRCAQIAMETGRDVFSVFQSEIATRQPTDRRRPKWYEMPDVPERTSVSHT